MKEEKNQTRKIIELLRHRHPTDEWANFVELRNATGFYHRQTRYIDFFAFNLWPSKKFWRVAYEIKVSRQDFINELNQPEKRVYAERYANETYFAMPPGIAQVGEIPESWGLIELVKNGLRIKKRAQQREVDNDSLPIAFAASIARQANLPPSDLPKATWLLAGKEVDQEQLLNAAGVSLEHLEDGIKREVERKVEREFRESDLYIKANKRKKLLDKYVGWSVTNDLELLEEWLSNKKNDRPDLPYLHKQKIINAHYELVSLMNAFNINPDGNQ